MIRKRLFIMVNGQKPNGQNPNQSKLTPTDKTPVGNWWGVTKPQRNHGNVIRLLVRVGLHLDKGEACLR